MLALLDRNAERWAMLAFYVMLVATMALEVIRREVFAYSSIWGEEVVRYCFIYLVWIGAAAAVRDRSHIRIDLLSGLLGPRGRAALSLFGHLVTFGVALIGLYWGVETVLISAKFGSVSHGLRVSMVWFLMAVPVGFSLICFRLLQVMREDLRGLATGRAPDAAAQMFE